MKHLYTGIFLLFCLCSNAQNDTIALLSGTLFTSIVHVENNGKQLRITDVRGKVFPIEREFVGRVILGDTIRSVYGWTSYTAKNSQMGAPVVEEIKPVQLHQELAEISDSRNYLKVAGSWGISASVLTVGGIVTAITGYALKNETVVYAGAGMTGAGLILYIPAFVNVLKAGRMRNP